MGSGSGIRRGQEGEEVYEGMGDGVRREIRNGSKNESGSGEWGGKIKQ
jgi:hypothetical protein